MLIYANFQWPHGAVLCCNILCNIATIVAMKVFQYVQCVQSLHRYEVWANYCLAGSSCWLRNIKTSLRVSAFEMFTWSRSTNRQLLTYLHRCKIGYVLFIFFINFTQFVLQQINSSHFLHVPAKIASPPWPGYSTTRYHLAKFTISQLTNLCTGIRSQPPPISPHPLRCSFGCVLLWNQIYLVHNVLFDNITPIYLINLPWKLGLGLRLDLKMHYFSIFHGE